MSTRAELINKYRAKYKAEPDKYALAAIDARVARETPKPAVQKPTAPQSVRRDVAKKAKVQTPAFGAPRNVPMMDVPVAPEQAGERIDAMMGRTAPLPTKNMKARRPTDMLVPMPPNYLAAPDPVIPTPRQPQQMSIGPARNKLTERFTTPNPNIEQFVPATVPKRAPVRTDSPIGNFTSMLGFQTGELGETVKKGVAYLGSRDIVENPERYGGVAPKAMEEAQRVYNTPEYEEAAKATEDLFLMGAAPLTLGVMAPATVPTMSTGFGLLGTTNMAKRVMGTLPGPTEDPMGFLFDIGMTGALGHGPRALRNQMANLGMKRTLPVEPFASQYAVRGELDALPGPYGMGRLVRDGGVPVETPPPFGYSPPTPRIEPTLLPSPEPAPVVEPVRARRAPVVKPPAEVPIRSRGVKPEAATPTFRSRQTKPVEQPVVEPEPAPASAPVKTPTETFVPKSAQAHYGSPAEAGISVEAFIANSEKYRKSEITTLRAKANKARLAGQEETAQALEGEAAFYERQSPGEFANHVQQNPEYYMNSNVDPYLLFDKQKQAQINIIESLNDREREMLESMRRDLNQEFPDTDTPFLKKMEKDGYVYSDEIEPGDIGWEVTEKGKALVDNIKEWEYDENIILAPASFEPTPVVKKPATRKPKTEAAPATQKKPRAPRKPKTAPTETAPARTGPEPATAKEPWEMTQAEYGQQPITRVVGEDFSGDFLHGTATKNIKSLSATKRPSTSVKARTGNALFDALVPPESNEFGAEMLLAEPRQPHQAVIFSHGRGNSLASVSLKPGTRVLDLSDEIARAPRITFGNEPSVVRFFRRPSITDDLIRWKMGRISDGFKERNPDWASQVQQWMDPESPGFSVDEWRTSLVPYARDRGYGAIRLADETLLADRSVISNVRKATVDEVATAGSTRTYPGSRNASLFTDKPTGATKEAHEAAIKRALAEGKPVPAEVLADYPDLAAQYAPASAPSTSAGKPKPEPPTPKPEPKADRPVGVEGTGATGEETIKNSTPRRDRNRFSEPNQMVDFEKPIQGPNGSTLVAYKWSSKGDLVFSKREDGVVDALVSDWEGAIVNPVTGKNIVHQFFVQNPDGTGKWVSAESVPSALGFSVNAGRNIVSRIMRRDILTSEVRAFDERLTSLTERYRNGEEPSVSWKELKEAIASKAFTRPEAKRIYNEYLSQQGPPTERPVAIDTVLKYRAWKDTFGTDSTVSVSTRKTDLAKVSKAVDDALGESTPSTPLEAPRKAGGKPDTGGTAVTKGKRAEIRQRRAALVDEIAEDLGGTLNMGADPIVLAKVAPKLARYVATYVEEGILDFKLMAAELRKKYPQLKGLTARELKRSWEQHQEDATQWARGLRETNPVKGAETQPAPAPKVEPPKMESTESPKPKTASIKNAAVEEVRERYGAPELTPHERKTHQQYLDTALKNDLASRSREILEDAIDNARDLTGPETAGIAVRFAELEKERMASIETVRGLRENGTPEQVAVEMRRRDALEQEFVELSDMTKRTGTTTAQALEARKMLLNIEDYSLVTLLKNAKERKGSALTEAEVAKYEKMAEDYAKAKADVERLTKENDTLIAEQRKAKAEQVIETEARKRSVKSKANQSVESIRARREQLKKELVGMGYRLNDVTGLGLEASYKIGQIARTYVEEGIVRLDEVVKLVQADFPKLTATEIHQAIIQPDPARKGRVTSEPVQKWNAVKKEARIGATTAELESQLAEGKFTKREPPPRPTKSVELERAEIALRDLRRHVRDALRDQESWKIKDLPTAGKVAAKALSTVNNLQRTLRATADVSATLRQGLILSSRELFRDPVGLGKNFGKSMRAMANKYSFEQLQNAMTTDPRFYLYRKSGGHFSDLHGNLSHGEELYQSGLAEKIPGLRHIVAGSERHMTAYLNLLRTDAFYKYMDSHPMATTGELEAVANMGNVFSGRGNLGSLEQAAPMLGQVFFAPRFAMSRIQAPFAPFTYWKYKGVRAEAIKSLAATAAFGGTMLAMAKMAGAEVGTDPRSPDFMKIRIGNTRIDPWGGMQQPARLWMRAALQGGSFAGLTEGVKGYDVSREVSRYGLYKLSPLGGDVYILLSGGKNVIGENVKEWSTGKWVKETIIPIAIGDVVDAYESKGLGMAVGVGVAASLGVSTSTYSVKLETASTAERREEYKRMNPKQQAEFRKTYDVRTGKKLRKAR